MVVLSALADLLIIVDVLTHWGLGWFYVLSPRFRKSVHERWQTTAKPRIALEAIFVALSFVVSNLVILFILVIIFAGPLPQVHEW